jgi:heme o synthase
VVADFIELTKPRIVLLVMVTVAAGFYLGAVGQVSEILLLHTLAGTALVAAGTNALNQVFEADYDALMRRTMRRPLPAGRLSPTAAAVFAWSVGVAGVAYLTAMVNWWSAVLAALTLGSYVFIYTPLKRRTSFATLIGAVPGALPIVGGWAAARGVPETGAWVLFAILFLWQLPHFLALAWMYREDYSRAGFRMISLDDTGGRSTFRQATVYAAALMSVALAPTLIGVVGIAYFWGGLILSAGMLWAAATAAQAPTPERARRLFKASVMYLPALLTLMVLDKVS